MAAFDTQVWAEVPGSFWALTFFLFGSVVGSFLNVCIHRLPRDESIVSPPSHCPHCRYEIPWYLNIPLVTWLFLRGRCANCGAPISIRYFLVELLTAVCFWACWLGFGAVSPWLALTYCLLLAGFIVASFIDFEHLIIPDPITLGGTVAGFLCSFAVPLLHHTTSAPRAMRDSVLGLVCGAGLFYTVLRLSKWLFGRQRFAFPEEERVVFKESGIQMPDREIPYEEVFYRKTDAILFKAKRAVLTKSSYHFAAKRVKWGVQFQAWLSCKFRRDYRDVQVKLAPDSLRVGQETFDPAEITRLEAVTLEIVIPREGMGLGDVKFMAAVGAFLGWKGVLFCLFASSILGTAINLPLVALNHWLKREWSSQIPYGPYLAMAATLWVFTGETLLRWIFPY